MEFESFTQSISSAVPPEGINTCLLSLWYDANNNWHKAHSLVDSLHDVTACHVHAYLHRKEGDMGNAAYWYSRAGTPMPRISLAEEWEHIVKSLL